MFFKTKEIKPVPPRQEYSLTEGQVKEAVAEYVRKHDALAPKGITVSGAYHRNTNGYGADYYLLVLSEPEIY